MQNYVTRTAGTLAVLGVSFLTSCGMVVPIDLLHEHDEPVIIEIGSIKMDFNPLDSRGVRGYLSSNGKHFYRGNAPRVKRVRVWLKSKEGSFQEAECANSLGVAGPCEGEALDPNSMNLTLSNSKEISFSWYSGERDGLLMWSPDQPFRLNSANPGSYGHRIIAENVSLEKVRFRFWNREQCFARPPDGDIVIKLCTALENGHCPDRPR